MQMGEYFSHQPLDFLVLLGDRYELLPVALNALLFGIPIIHISGGDITEGAIDDQIRHALTKMAHVHFPGTRESADRIIRMGEEPWRICITGELSLDAILNLRLRTKEELFESLKLDPALSVICATFHPETIENKITPDFINTLCLELVKEPTCQIVLTAANADVGGYEINTLLRTLPRENRRIHFFESLGQLNYFSLLAQSSVVLGNSSSGIVEAKSFNVPVVDVGKRQKGRVANSNVIHADPTVPAIVTAITCVQDGNFRERFCHERNIHGDGKAVERMMTYLKECDRSKLLAKKFIY